MNYGEEYRSLMAGLYTGCELQRIGDAKVAISGAGGAIGSYLLDLLARKGFERFMLSDPDVYETRNISRQLFATCPSLGKAKLELAVEHLLQINPQAQCATIPCVDAGSVEQFVDGASVVSHQAEGFSSWVLTLHACARRGVPFINVARKGNVRTTGATRSYDFRLGGADFSIRSVDFASFGIPPILFGDIVRAVEKGDPDPALLNEADAIHIEFKRNKRFRSLKRMYPEVGSIEERYPDDYHKRYTEPEICLLAAALAGRAITDVVIGRTTRVMELDIFSVSQ